ncbi:unnamed protein product [Scytosiphon promiscuus]
MVLVKKLPSSQQSLREDRLEPRLRHKQQLNATSSAGAGSGGDRRRSSNPQGGDRAVTTDGEGALSAVLVPPRAAARRVAAAASHGPERDRDRGRRDRGNGFGGALGGPARVVSRRRVSMGGSGSGGTVTAAVAALGVDRGARGFDATPYRTTVHFRDR